MVLVYCEHITPRHSYILSFLFKEILGLDYRLVSDRDAFILHDGPRFSYGNGPAGDGIHFRAHAFMGETGAREQDIQVTTWQGLPVFFRVEGPSVWPFDPFAVMFYLISRYEEYLPFQADPHGRFSPENSLAHRYHFLDIPLVDILAGKILELLKAGFTSFIFPGRKFTFQPTFDIDIAYAHLGKGALRAMAGWLKLILAGDTRQLRERWAVITGKTEDPYDNFSLQLELAAEAGLKPIYFALLGDFGKFDRNVSFRNKRFRQLLQRLGMTATLGIHPSYRSHLHPERLEREMGRLADITGKPVTISRFHFLRLRFPDSYRMLEQAGIREDYSLGYSTCNGFRAGTAHPFHFYDLLKEKESTLKLHPFIFMDSAMIDRLNYSPAQGEAEIESLVGKVMENGGEATGVWHNYSLCDKGPYRGWQDVLIRTFLKYKNTRS